MTLGSRVALIEDHTILAEALHVSLSSRGFQVVEVRLATSDGPLATRALLAATSNAEVDIVLLDLDLGPAGDGGRLIEPLTLAGQRVVVLTGSAGRARWGECLAHGALTVLPKTAPLRVIVKVLQRACDGLPVMPAAQRDELVQLWLMRTAGEEHKRQRFERLTPREAHVLGELVRGRRVKDIADAAFVSEATVRTQVKSLLAKLGVTSQLAAVALAREAGWSTPRSTSGTGSHDRGAASSDAGARPGPR